MPRAKPGRPATRKTVKQDERPQRAAALVAIRGGADHPPQPVGPSIPNPKWLKVTKDAWVEFWSSDVSAAVTAATRPAVERLFNLRDEQERAWRLYRKTPYVEGSTGQPRINPAFDAAMKLEGAITALEDRIGLTPKAMANLGIVIGQAQLTAADLNRMALEAAHGDDDQEAIVDAEILGEWEAG